jgi:MoaA/NifB/PqqE/SkfB family radical SAM enzyme
MKSLVSLALRYPEYATQKLKKKVRGKVLAKLDYYFGNGFSMSPTTVSFNLTHICNLRCKMCAQYGQNGIFNNAKKDTIKGVLSINELRGIIDEIAVFKPDIYIWGGEPLLHPNFIDFVEYIKKRNLICVVNTNGTILQRYAHKLVSIGLDSIDLSLDGPQQMHDKIRGVPGTFKKVIAGLEAILMAKNDNLNSKPFIKLVTVITEDNYEFLEQVVQIARNYNIDYMELAYGWSVSQKMGEMTDKIFESNFQCGATSWKGFLTDCHKLDVQKLKKILQKIKNIMDYTLILFQT